MVPPKVPVYSYHCMIFGLAANTFPRFSQGQLICQCRCKNSHEHQKAMKVSGIIILGRLHFFIRCHAPNTQLIKNAFNTMAATDPGGVLFQIHHVTPTFHIKNAGKEFLIPCQKTSPFFAVSNLSLSIKSGINAKKIKKVNP